MSVVGDCSQMLYSWPHADDSAASLTAAVRDRVQTPTKGKEWTNVNGVTLPHFGDVRYWKWRMILGKEAVDKSSKFDQTHQYLKISFDQHATRFNYHNLLFF